MLNALSFFAENSSSTTTTTFENRTGFGLSIISTLRQKEGVKRKKTIKKKLVKKIRKVTNYNVSSSTNTSTTLHSVFVELGKKLKKKDSIPTNDDSWE